MEKRRLQIQPQFQDAEEWAKLAETYDFGYECIELSMPPFLTDEGLTDAAKEWYKKSGRLNAVHGCFIDVNPASGDKKFRDLSKQRCRESCELAIEQGARRIVFHSSAFPFLRGGYLEMWTKRSVNFFDRLSKEYDLEICIENSFDTDPTPLRVLMEGIDSDRVGVCLDIGHVNHSRAPLQQWFDELGAYIRYLHISDNMGQFDDHLPVGDGTVDWKEADRLYRQLGKNLPMTLEVGGIEGVKRSMRYIEENGLFKEIRSNE